MGHGPEQHVEHAQHFEHAAHNPFDRNVTVSIAIVAAVLAAVTMLGHKAHVETVRLQALVAVIRTDIADQYAYYQAKNNRAVLYEGFIDLSDMLPLKDNSEKVKELHDKARGTWDKQSKKYKKELPEMLKKAEELKKESEEHQKQSHVEHAKADRFDMGELGLQLGVVLCSMAILTKSRGFWFTGLLCSLAGFLVALTGVLGMFMDMGHH